MTLQIQPRILPYSGQLQSRSLDDIDLLVVHCTELPDLAMAREYGERIHYPESGTGNSGHYYIDRDGTTELWVPEDRVAHHVRGYNERSVGIELVNTGRYPHWFHSGNQQMSETYRQSQVDSLCLLIEHLRETLPQLYLIAGHEDLDESFVTASNKPNVGVRRKRDPGEQFPWPDVLARTGMERFRPDSYPLH